MKDMELKKLSCSPKNVKEDQMKENGMDRTCNTLGSKYEYKCPQQRPTGIERQE
jgi:hypothetical protein